VWGKTENQRKKEEPYHLLLAGYAPSFILWKNGDLRGEEKPWKSSSQRRKRDNEDDAGYPVTRRTKTPDQEKREWNEKERRKGRRSMKKGQTTLARGTT